MSKNYSYDAASQFTGNTYKLGSNTLGNLTYSYDLAGRRTGVGGSYARTGVPQAASSASYNVNNQLTNWKGATLTYDANGNLTSDGTNSYTWNARNQLISISGGVTASFQYDAFGRRVSKTIGGTTQFLYDGPNPVQEISGSSASANLFTGGVDEYFQRTDAAGARSFLTDSLGSTLALADSSGTVQTSYTFEPFGNTTVTGSATTNSFAYTGRELDPTGLYLYRARYYNPSLQRFVAEDPIGFSNGESNLCAYAGDSPASFKDPTGLIRDPSMTPFGQNLMNPDLAHRKPPILFLQATVFFQALGRNFVNEFKEGGCVAAFIEAAREPSVDIHHASEGALEVGGGLVGAGLGAGWLANELYPMSLSQGTGPKLDPFLGPVVIAGARAVASTAGRLGLAAEEAVAEYGPYGLLGAVDLSLLYGFDREMQAYGTGKCE